MIALFALSLVLLLGLMVVRRGFWYADIRLPAATAPKTWPSVTAIVPARDEAQTIADCLTSLAAQDYEGDLTIILVDDDSSDGTGEIAQALNLDRPVTVLQAPPLEPGWSGMCKTV